MHCDSLYIAEHGLEMVLQTREVVDAMRQDADLSQLKCLKVDGGASRNGLLMQLQADALQVSLAIHRSEAALSFACKTELVRSL